MNFDWLDNSLWKPIGKGLSEADTFMRREMPFGMGWGAPAAALGAYFAAPYIGSALGAGEAAGAGGIAEAGGLTTGGPIFVDPTVAGYGEGLSGLGFDTAAEQAAIANSGGAFSGAELGGLSGNQYINNQLAGLGPEAFTQGGAISVDPTVAGYGENLSSIPGYGFNTAAEQEAIANSGGLFSSGEAVPSSFSKLMDSLGFGQSSPAASEGYGTSLDDYLKEKGLDGSGVAEKAKSKFDLGKSLASALKGMGDKKKTAFPQYTIQPLQRQREAQQANNANQMGMMQAQGIVQPSQNQALAQQLRLLPTGNRLA